MKKLRKVSVLGLFAAFMLFININVNASSATCVYDRFQVTVEDGAINVTAVSNAAYYDITSHLTVSDFTNSAGELKCLSNIYIVAWQQGRVSNVVIYNQEKDGGYAKALTDSEVENGSSGGGGSTSGTQGAGRPTVNGGSDDREPTGAGNANTNINCGAFDGIIDWLQTAFNIIKIGGPILAIILGMVDFAKCAVSGKDDESKTAWKHFSKRLIAAALLFLIPVLVNWILNIIDISNGTCGIS